MRLLVTSFYLIDFVIPVILIIFFIIIYGLIIRNLVRIKAKTIRISVTSATSSESYSGETLSTNAPYLQSPVHMDLNSDQRAMSPLCNRRTPPGPSRSTTRPEVKLTIMTIVITIIFILSYIPYFIVILYSNLVLKIPRYELNVGIQIIFRFFIINCATNPYVFLIFNSAFRRFVNGFLCCKKHILDPV